MDRLRKDERFSQRRLDEFRTAAQTKLSPERFQKLTEEDLARFIVAREGNVSAALKQLQGSVEWTETVLEGPNKHECPLCRRDPTCHSHVPIGVIIEETEKSTILYGCPARATHSAVDPIVHHVSQQLEYCFSLPHTGSRWIWCVDYNGFGLKEALQGKLAAKFGSLFNNHMPERLHKILLLNPPSVFRLLLQAAKPFVDQRTLDKLIPVTGSTQKVLQTLQEEHSFPTNALNWLEEALNQRLPNDLPALPHDSRGLMLPSLIPVFPFVDPATPTKASVPAAGVKASSLLAGQLDAQNQIRIVGSY